MFGVTTHPRRRLGGALTFSIVVHLLVLAALVWVRYASPPNPSGIARVEPPDERIVWIATPGPRGGGGGGRTLSPPPAEPAPPIATRTEEAAAPLPVPVDEPQPTAEPVDPPPAAPAVIAEAANAGAAVTPATAGDGRDAGPGSGSGDGPGIGPGRDGGSGGGQYLAGNGVSSPIPIQRGTPNYTDDAVRNRAQGVIVVACVVEPNGECGDVSVVRTFTPPYGLDQQALAAARRWRFRPGTREGKAVPVLVNLEIEFRIH